MKLFLFFLQSFLADQFHPDWKRTPKSTKTEAWSPEEETNVRVFELITIKRQN